MEGARQDGQSGQASPRRLTRRRFLGAMAALAATGGSAWGYTFRYAPYALQVETKQVPMGLPLRLLHLSDLHASSHVSMEYLEEAIQKGLAERPDLICLTGDFFTHSLSDADADRYATVLRKLSDAAVTLACAGNHDGGSWAVRYGGYADLGRIRKVLDAAGVRLLVNEIETVTVTGREIDVVGIGDFWTKELYEPARAFAGARGEGRPRIVLSHNPDSKEDLLPHGWDLLLCGHTHGGQVRLPFLGTPFAPVSDQRFVEGLHRWAGRWLHVTRGVGNVMGARFNCPPEVSVLVLA